MFQREKCFGKKNKQNKKQNKTKQKKVRECYMSN